MLEIVGLTAVASQRAGKFSLGMGQRLGIAAALLGDPDVLLFDEPVNGLDPDGIRWVRNLLKGLAREGRTVFVSSHLMSEMALTADEVVIIGRGRLICADPGRASSSTRARSASSGSGRREIDALPRRARVRRARPRPSKTTARSRCAGWTRSPIGELAASLPVVLHELSPQSASLEEAFMELTEASIEYHGSPSSTPATIEGGAIVSARSSPRLPMAQRCWRPSSAITAAPTPSASSSSPSSSSAARPSPCNDVAVGARPRRPDTAPLRHGDASRPVKPPAASPQARSPSRHRTVHRSAAPVDSPAPVRTGRSEIECAPARALRHLGLARLGVDEAADRPLDDVDARDHRRARHRGRRSLATAETRAHWATTSPGNRLGFDPISTSLIGVFIGQFAIGVLGVLVMSGEYGTGTIRATFAAAPRRPLVLVAKVIVFGVVALVVAEVVSFLAFFIGQALLTAPAPHATLGSPGACARRRRQRALRRRARPVLARARDDHPPHRRGDQRVRRRPARAPADRPGAPLRRSSSTCAPTCPTGSARRS